MSDRGYANDMMETHPRRDAVDEMLIADCVSRCFSCEQVCTSCADACLAEDAVASLRRCIRLNLDCGDICDATGNVLARLTGWTPRLVAAQLESCRKICVACAEECESHAGAHPHCEVCASACRRCEEACAELILELR